MSIVHLFWASCRIRTNDPEITNHVLWPTELKRQVGKLTTSRRYNQVPLLRSSPGGFRGSMPCRTYPGAKVDIIFYNTSVFCGGRPYLFVSGWKPFVFRCVKKCMQNIWACNLLESSICRFGSENRTLMWNSFVKKYYPCY